ncbi:MAG: signal recognition particle-docking protein FtsY [Nitrospiria bacterium]
MNLFQKLREGLSRTRTDLERRLTQIFMGTRSIGLGLLESIEEFLIAADLGAAATQRVMVRLREGFNHKGLVDLPQLKHCLKQEFARIFQASSLEIPYGKDELSHEKSIPHTILIVGVNGVGKTTTIGKLSAKFRAAGKKVLLAAGDTFRAAAIEQLGVWARHAQCDVITQQPGSDPSAVVFDAVAAAKARGVDILIVDTAGRLHTKFNLMEELKKIKRVMAKALPGSPHQVLLVLDATTGQNALSQARRFHEAVGVTGIVMAKLDGTGKGGILIAIAEELKIPVRYIGVGEGIDDLLEFEPQAFVQGLFE